MLIISDAKDNTLILDDANNTVWAIGARGCEGQVWVLHWIEDLNDDGVVNYSDFALLANDWLECTDRDLWGTSCDYWGEYMYLSTDIDRSLYIDFDDVAAIANRWLYGSTE